MRMLMKIHSKIRDDRVCEDIELTKIDYLWFNTQFTKFHLYKRSPPFNFYIENEDYNANSSETG